jgi:hypothetical protein
MKNQEILGIIGNLERVGINGPLTKFGSDLDNVIEAPGRYGKGAKAFFDPITKATYVSHANGYVRRYIEEKYWRSGETIVSRYALNKRISRKITDAPDYRDGVFILLPNEEDRINLISRSIRNYRKSR